MGTRACAGGGSCASGRRRPSGGRRWGEASEARALEPRCGEVERCDASESVAGISVGVPKEDAGEKEGREGVQGREVEKVRMEAGRRTGDWLGLSVVGAEVDVRLLLVVEKVRWWGEGLDGELVRLEGGGERGRGGYGGCIVVVVGQAVGWIVVWLGEELRGEMSVVARRVAIRRRAVLGGGSGCRGGERGGLVRLECGGEERSYTAGGGGGGRGGVGGCGVRSEPHRARAQCVCALGVDAIRKAAEPVPVEMKMDEDGRGWMRTMRWRRGGRALIRRRFHQPNAPKNAHRAADNAILSRIYSAFSPKGGDDDCRQMRFDCDSPERARIADQQNVRLGLHTSSIFGSETRRSR
ncbi:hypothetical protein L1887_51944 [Cichorium endivia]|nr:hypothetical protein L1887_51944 [Cichorium endivia]